MTYDIYIEGVKGTISTKQLESLLETIKEDSNPRAAWAWQVEFIPNGDGTADIIANQVGENTIRIQYDNK